MNIRTLYPILFLVLLSSCMNYKEKKLEALVKEWAGKEILLPKSLIFTQFAIDTVHYEVQPSKYKVVVFVDSAGCVGCKLQLTRWKEFINEVDSLCGSNIPFVFILQTNKIQELRTAMIRDGFSHPVCIDTEGRIKAINKIPDDIMFQTFLVDSTNHVKVIGNPVYNISIRKLFLREMAGIKSEALRTTSLRPDSMEYHYGLVSKDRFAHKKIFLYNTGNETFHLEGVTTSCECIEAKYDWNEISPGESAVVSVDYNAIDIGDFWRTITIYGNIPKKSITLDFFGTVTQSQIKRGE